MSPWLSTSHFRCLFIIIIFFDIRVSYCTDDPKYLSCASAFECGEVKNITYPFWGNGRPEYCGHRDFELKCLNETVYIEIQSQNYTISSIDEVKHTMFAFPAKNNYTNICPSQFFNISIQFDLFHISTPSTQTLTLFYSCPSISQLMNNRFDCSVNGNKSNNYFLVNDNTGVISGAPPDISRCQFIVEVHVLQTILVDKFSSYSVESNPTQTALTLEALLSDGFEVGFVMDITVCNECENSGGRCGYELHSVQPTCYCYDGPNPRRCASKHHSDSQRANITKRKIAIAVSSTGALIAMIFITSVYVFRRKRMLSKRKTASIMDFEAFLENQASLAIKRYTFKEIKLMTNHFKNKIGQGGYGSVFKGNLNDGSFVAVKVLGETKGNGEEFINEVASISKTSHVNIVSLLGYCFDEAKRALIYEFMPNGSLENYIYDKKQSEAYTHLGWETFYQVSVGIARGLEYLHQGCSTRILHFDIKPHNILLDQEFCPKISDFGLAKLCPRKGSIISILGARGTFGYIAPEVFCRNFGGVSHKSDVYSYGMMLLEITGGRDDVDLEITHTSDIYFPNYVYTRIESNEDLGIHGVLSEADREITRKMILVGLWCIQTSPSDRPSMSRVLEMLEGSLEVLPIPPKPYISSSPRAPVGSSITSESLFDTPR